MYKNCINLRKSALWKEKGRFLCYNASMSNGIHESPKDSNGIVVTEAELEIMERQTIGLLKKLWAIQNKNKIIANLDRGDVWIKGKRQK